MTKISLWKNVPESQKLQEKLNVARDTNAPTQQRENALAYLYGAQKVLARIDARRALAEYLMGVINDIRAELYGGPTRRTASGHR